jgi:hypothetical protein
LTSYSATRGGARASSALFSSRISGDTPHKHHLTLNNTWRCERYSSAGCSAPPLCCSSCACAWNYCLCMPSGLALASHHATARAWGADDGDCGGGGGGGREEEKRRHMYDSADQVSAQFTHKVSHMAMKMVKTHPRLSLPNTVTTPHPTPMCLRPLASLADGSSTQSALQPRCGRTAERITLLILCVAWRVVPDKRLLSG